MEVEHCIRRDGEEVRNFLHRIARAVDKGWPDEMIGISNAQHNAELAAQGRQKRQGCMDFRSRGLRPRYLQRKAQDYLMEHPNGRWNDFCAQIIRKDVILQVSSEFLLDVERKKCELAAQGQEVRNLREDLQEHRIIAIEGTFRPIAPTQRENKNLPGSVIIVIKTDTLQVGVAKKCEMKKNVIFVSGDIQDNDQLRYAISKRFCRSKSCC